MPQIHNKIKSMQNDFHLKDTAISWFDTLFTDCLPEAASLQVLDLYFLYGQGSSMLIFDIAMGYLKTLEQQIV